MTLTLDIGSTTTNTGSRAVFAQGTASAGQRAPRGMPPVVPASELYFWTEKWQAQEREFEQARGKGELIEASSMCEVILDLMRLDD